MKSRQQSHRNPHITLPLVVQIISKYDTAPTVRKETAAPKNKMFGPKQKGGMLLTQNQMDDLQIFEDKQDNQKIDREQQLNDSRTRSCLLDLVTVATTHKSVNSTINHNYERLEFLGDSIISLAVIDYLFDFYSDENVSNGFLTGLKSKIVNTESLADLCKCLGLDRFIQYRDTDYASRCQDSAGASRSGNRNIQSRTKLEFDKLSEDVFEAFVGAVYLTRFEKDMNRTIKFIGKIITEHVKIPKLLMIESNFRNLLSTYYWRMYKEKVVIKTDHVYKSVSATSPSSHTNSSSCYRCKTPYPSDLHKYKMVHGCERHYFSCWVLVRDRPTPKKDDSSSDSDSSDDSDSDDESQASEQVRVAVSGPDKSKCEKECARQALLHLGVINDQNILTDPTWCSYSASSSAASTNDEQDAIILSESKILNNKNKLISFEAIGRLVNRVYGLTSNCIVISRARFDHAMFIEAMTHKSYLVRLDSDDSRSDSGDSEESDSDDDSDSEEDLTNAVLLRKTSNAKLALYGDSVIHEIIGEYLYHRFPCADQGDMSKMRKILENRKRSIYEMACKSGIGEWILISRNIENKDKRFSSKIITVAFIAFVAALYKQTDHVTCCKYLHSFLDPMNLTLTEIDKFDDFRGKLRIYCKSKRMQPPQFNLISETGPDNCKIFTVGLYIDDNYETSGAASSKKEAMQIASRKYLERNRR